MIDIRNHIIYGVDDGSLNLLQSESILHKLYMEGVTTIIATPNYGVGCVNPSHDELNNKLNHIRVAAEKIGGGIKVHLGSELYYSEDLLESLRKKQAITLADTRYVLINHHSEITYVELKTAIHKLLIRGYYPIITQVDKYICLIDNFNYIDELVQLGACMEIDTASFSLNRFGALSSFIKSMLEYDMLHFIGSNAKTDLVKNYGMKEVFEIVKLRYGKEKAHKIFYEHGEMIFNNKNISRVC